MTDVTLRIFHVDADPTDGTWLVPRNGYREDTLKDTGKRCTFRRWALFTDSNRFHYDCFERPCDDNPEDSETCFVRVRWVK